MPLSQFKDQTILITGGSGSFGRAMAKRLILDNSCKKVIIFSRDEWKQWEMKQSDPAFAHPKMRYFLGDVRDSERLHRAFNEVDFVIHAAALKQVPAAEYNPTEFVKTNVIGAMNVIDATIACGVKKVIALSTDKAVNPINLYGATKLCSDKIFIAGNSYVGARGYPRFSVVRYGNVSGSRGSIIPLWKKMLEEGAESLPLTDTRMTRFWITLDQAVDFVIQCFSTMRFGEVFVPKIPSIRIPDLFEAIAPGKKFKICGIRDGEKLHEVMISSDDARHTFELKDHYIIIPESFTHDLNLLAKFLDGREGQFTPENFSYASNTNSAWLTIEELKLLVNKM
jgi:UDP-N-acetylglucosamine 4,6-dehydratase